MRRKTVNATGVILLGSLAGFASQAKAQTQMEPLPATPVVVIEQLRSAPGDDASTLATNGVTVLWSAQTAPKTLLQQFVVLVEVLPLLSENPAATQTVSKTVDGSQRTTTLIGTFRVPDRLDARVTTRFLFTGGGTTIAEKSFDLGGLDPQQIRGANQKPPVQ